MFREQQRNLAAPAALSTGEMRVRLTRSPESRGRAAALRRPHRAAPPEPCAPAPPALAPTPALPPRPRERERDDLADERRLRDSGGPQDAATYTCGCGMVFDAPVSTSVRCPNCGGAQAW